MSWVPQNGELFYVAFRPKDRIVDGGFGSTTVVQYTDGSYRHDIFRMIARDDRMYIAKNVYGGYNSDKPTMFVRKEVYFMPVGPDVVKVLGLEIDESK